MGWTSMLCNVIATGSTGNAVVLDKDILIDCGVPFGALENVYKDIKIVLLTHIHGDHFNPTTIKRLHYLRPALRFACAPWLVKPLLDIGVNGNMIDQALPAAGSYLRYGSYGGDETYVGCERIPHDVDNCCWHIWRGAEKAFYATDCGSLTEIAAKDYDLYLIEANYDEDELAEREARKLAAGEFSYEARAAAAHLSTEQAKAWLAQNAEMYRSKVIFLHQHQEREENHVVRGPSNDGEAPENAQAGEAAQG